MKLIAFSLLLAATMAAQTVTDVMNQAQLALTPSTVALTVTASQGDGSVCKLTKANGSGITATLSCVSGDGKTSFNTAVARSASGAAVAAMPLGIGDVLCLLGFNPTAAAVAMGSLGLVPASSVGWSCSTNIRTAGLVTGQTMPTAGSVSWP